MAEREPGEEHDETERGPERGPGGRFRRLGRRILGEGEERGEARERGERGILGDAREVFGAVLEGSDKAKSEVVRAVAREVRNYLDELGLKDDIHNLLTNYSFEIHASVNLRKLSDAEKAPREPKEARPSRKSPVVREEGEEGA